MPHDRSELTAAEPLDGNYFRVPDELVTSGAAAGWNGAALAVYIVLLKHRNRSTGRAFPTLETLSELTGLHKGTVSRAIRVLEEWSAVSTCDEDGGWHIYRPVAPAQLGSVAQAQQRAESGAPAQLRVAPALQSVAPALREVAPALGAYKDEPNVLTQQVNPRPAAPGDGVNAAAYEGGIGVGDGDGGESVTDTDGGWVPLPLVEDVHHPEPVELAGRPGVYCLWSREPTNGEHRVVFVGQGADMGKSLRSWGLVWTPAGGFALQRNKYLTDPELFGAPPPSPPVPVLARLSAKFIPNQARREVIRRHQISTFTARYGGPLAYDTITAPGRRKAE